MRIYLSHSSGFDYKTELYEPIRKKFTLSHDIRFPHDIGNDSADSKDILAKCDVLIAEVSFPSTGQGIELGWADMMKIPSIYLRRKGSKVSSALQYMNAYEIVYNDITDMLASIEKVLAEREQARS